MSSLNGLPSGVEVEILGAPGSYLVEGEHVVVRVVDRDDVAHSGAR